MAPDPKARRAPATRPDVEDFTRSVHASYLSRWRRHDPSGLEKAAEPETPAAPPSPRRKRTSAA